MSDRSGVAPVELAVLEVLDAAVSGRPRAHARSAKALAGIEERLGLGPRYAYGLLLDLARPWVIPVRTVTMQGNVGDRSFFPTLLAPGTPSAALPMSASSSSPPRPISWRPSR